MVVHLTKNVKLFSQWQREGAGTSELGRLVNARPKMVSFWDNGNISGNLPMHHLDQIDQPKQAEKHILEVIFPGAFSNLKNIDLRKAI